MLKLFRKPGFDVMLAVYFGLAAASIIVAFALAHQCGTLAPE